MIPVYLLGLAVLLGGSEASELRRWNARAAADFETAVLEGVQVHPDSLVILAALSGEQNLALGHPVLDEFGNQVPLSDGSIAAIHSEWSSGTPQVFGRTFLLDLGVDRAVARVRVLAGETAVFSRPEYFMRGYRIEVAEQSKADFWHAVAEARENFLLNVDTRLDGTWLDVSPAGEPLPTIGRFVRLTLTRQDRSNWVVLGEIEVYGSGYDSRGSITGTFTSQEPVNVGRMRWRADAGAGTSVQIQFRGLPIGAEPAAWDLLPHETAEVLFAESEPVVGVQYRAVLATASPFATPALRAVEIDCDPVLVAEQVLGSVQADSAVLGERAAFRYSAEVAVEPDNYGIDLVRLEGATTAVTEMRFDGVPVSFAAFQDSGGVAFELSASNQIVVSGHLEMEGAGVFVRHQTPLVLSVGSRDQAARDGYVNWQIGRQDPAATWTVQARGARLQVLSRVEVSPQPFSPLAGEELTFLFVVGQILEESELTVRIFKLTGELVRKLQRLGDAGQYQMNWNGRDRNNQVVEPGLYLYEISVDARGLTSNRRGAFAVAY